MIRLDATTELPERPFAALASTRDDLAIMERMLARLRGHVAALPGVDDTGPMAEAAAAGTQSRDDHHIDPDDHGIHHIVLTDIPRIRRPGDLVIVGFFGQARLDVDHAPIIDLETALIADMASAANPLVYYNVHWPGIGWGNLVLFADLATERGWGHDPRHHDAVARSPAHYHSIRLHIGTLPGGLADGRPVALDRTRYFDFSGPEPWKAVRTLDPDENVDGEPRAAAP